MKQRDHMNRQKSTQQEVRPITIPPTPSPGSSHAEWREWAKALSAAGKI